MNIVERQFIKLITSRLKKHLNKPELEQWYLILDYVDDRIYFKIDDQELEFEDSVKIIKEYLIEKYSDFENENNCKILFVIVSSASLTVTVNYKNLDTNKTEFKTDKL